MRSIRILALVFGLWFAFHSQAGAVTLTWDSGILTGARGVSIGEASYDVSFQDGAISSLYGPNYQFIFQTIDEAMVASSALFSQAIAGTGAGTDPGLVRGLAGGTGWVTTPYSVIPYYDEGLVVQGDGPLLGSLPWGSYEPGSLWSSTLFVDTDTTYLDTVTWALWSKADKPVPEPGTFLLLMAGLLGVAGYRRVRAKCDR